MNSPVKIELSALLALSVLFLNVAEASSKLVQTAIVVAFELGIKPRLQTSSTNSNIPMAKNVPAITLSRGGKGNDAYPLNESWTNKEDDRNIKLTLPVLLVKAGLL